MTGNGKPFIDLDEQIEKLTSRGLIITNIEKTKQQLIKTTYYDLINGYKDIFLMPKLQEDEEDQFVNGTSLEDIIKLYNLDRHLRHAVLITMLDIESKFYASVSYSLGKVFGEKEEYYLAVNNFSRGKKQRHNNKYERDNLLHTIHKKIKYSNIQPLKYYRYKYKNIPPWILVKDLTFGEVVKLYQLSSREVKTFIVSSILGYPPTEKDFEIFSASIKLFNTFRNWSAHGGRIYNYKSRIQFPFLEYHDQVFSIQKEAYNQGKGREDFAALIIATLYFLNKDDLELQEFIIKLHTHLDYYQKHNPFQYEKIIFEMGIPSDYFPSIQEFLHQ